MLYKRNNIWWVRFTMPSGKRVRRSAKTCNKKEAQEFHDNLKATSWRQSALDDQPERSWQEAVIRWCSETNHKATHEIDKLHLKWIDTYLRDHLLSQINRDVSDYMTQQRLNDGVQNAKVNRMLEVVRAILRKCYREWGVVTKCAIHPHAS